MCGGIRMGLEELWAWGAAALQAFLGALSFQTGRFPCSLAPSASAPVPPVRSWLQQLSSLHAAHTAPASILDRAVSAAPDALPALTDSPSEAQQGFGARPYDQDTLDFIFELFEKFVDPILQHIRRHCREAIPSVDINLVTSTAKIFEVGVSNPVLLSSCSD